MTTPTILVTGGAGYIGAHVCRSLSRAGFRPIAYDDLSMGHRFLVQDGPLEVGDIRDRGRLDAVIAQHRPIACIHLAGLIAVGESVAYPERYAEVNEGGTAVLAGALRAADIQIVVMSSTCAVYGEPQEETLSEQHPLAPVNPYGRTKLAMERLFTECRVWGLRHFALRYFNAAGADPDGGIGEAHDPETHVIPLLLDAASARRAAFQIFGTDYPTPDGTAVRDYIHVSDLGAAHVLALGALLKGHEGGAVNLGTGTGVSVREMIRACERVTGRSIPVRDAARRVGDPPRLVSGGDTARAVLGWEPRRSEIKTILRDAWAWHRTYHGLQE